MTRPKPGQSTFEVVAVAYRTLAILVLSALTTLLTALALSALAWVLLLLATALSAAALLTAALTGLLVLLAALTRLLILLAAFTRLLVLLAALAGLALVWICCHTFHSCWGENNQPSVISFLELRTAIAVLAARQVPAQLLSLQQDKIKRVVTGRLGFAPTAGLPMC